MLGIRHWKIYSKKIFLPVGGAEFGWRIEILLFVRREDALAGHTQNVTESKTAYLFFTKNTKRFTVQKTAATDGRSRLSRKRSFAEQQPFPNFLSQIPMFIGYARVSKTDGSQVTDLQRDALMAAGVEPAHLYQDAASGKRDDRPGLTACLKALRPGDVLLVWKLDRLGRDLRHLVNTVQDLADRGIGFKVLAGQGANIDTTTAGGKLVFGIFAALAEFERELIRERTKAGLASARARGRQGGRRFALTKAQVRLAQAAMGQRETWVSELCTELGISRTALYRYVSPDGALRENGKRLLAVE